MGLQVALQRIRITEKLSSQISVANLNHLMSLKEDPQMLPAVMSVTVTVA